VGLRGEIVDLVGLHLLHDMDERGGVGHVAVVQDEVSRGNVWVFVDVVDARSVEAYELRRLMPCTSYPLASRNSARYAPSCPVTPVMSARFKCWGLLGMSRPCYLSGADWAVSGLWAVQ
jgi:hypothetical protein